MGVCPTKIQTGKSYENKLSTFFRLNLRLAELIIPKLIQIKYGNRLDRMSTAMKECLLSMMAVLIKKGGLENRLSARARGFESHPLRFRSFADAELLFA